MNRMFLLGKVYILFLSFEYIHRLSASYYNIGLYSSCVGKASNKTQAEHISNYYEKIIQERNEAEENKLPPNTLSYETYDVCLNKTYLALVIEKLTLTAKYYGVPRKYRHRNFTDSSILNVFTQMPRDMTDFVKASMFDYIPIVDVNDEYLEDGSIFSPTKSFADNLVQVVQNFGWQKLKLVSFTTSNPLYLGYKKESVEKLRQHNICIELFHIDPTTAIKSRS